MSIRTCSTTSRPTVGSSPALLSRARTARTSSRSCASSPRGVAVTVLGFREHANWALHAAGEVAHFEFVDLEDIEGVFREPLPRVNLDNLPEGGAWLQPFRPLAALLK